MVRRIVRKVQKIVQRLQSSTARALGYRPSSWPYVSGDTFRGLCELTIESPSDAEKFTETTKSAFVETHRIRDFLSAVTKCRNNSCVLVTGNGDDNVDRDLVEAVRGKVRHWFAQNVAYREPWITPVPIGLENLKYFWHGNVSSFERMRKTAGEKRFQILYGFTVNNNRSEREAALKSLEKCRAAERLKKNINPSEYRTTLKKYAFVASPEGNGLDCHRTWEALYLGVIPIVKRSAMTQYFFELGIPLWIVDSWQELENETVESLENRYRDFEGGLRTEKLWMPFWKRQIDSIKEVQR